jgi:hypothetical protein
LASKSGNDGDNGSAAGVKKAGKDKSSGGNGSEPGLEQKPVGSAKGIETMFRNAYMAELEIITLAATKANIMISLNGFIVSALMISGAFIYASSPAFLVPAGVFLFTAAASIFFALLSASPEKTDLFSGVWDWFKAVLRRKARLRDLNEHVNSRRQFVDGKSNILIYEDRVRLSKDEYWDRMRRLLTDQENVYQHMSDQLYWLGQMASRKFKLLNASYSVFRWGLIASVIAFVSVKSIQQLLPVIDGDAVVRLRNVGISEFQDIYEPSAVQQLPDGRLLVVEDEASRALSLMQFAQDGTLFEDAAVDTRLIRGFRRKLSDLEGLTMDERGYVYAITSHSRTSKGKRSSDREQLLRFRIEGNDVRQIGAYEGLVDALEGSMALQSAIKAKVGKGIDFDTINIEGLNFDQRSQKLLLGFREPMVDGQSMIVVIENPNGIFERNEEPRFGDAILLELQGGGIRSLSYDPVLGVFLMVNEIVGHEGNTYSQLWSWSGERGASPEPIALPDIINLNNVESIDSITVNGESRLLIMSDEGSVKKGSPAKYMLLDYGQVAP